VEKASISSAGAFTSTTIDATKLTGNLPAISGASLTGVGKVLQVVQSTSITNSTISTSYADVSGASITITPSSASSQILITYNAGGMTDMSNANNAIHLKLNSSKDGDIMENTRITYSAATQHTPLIISQTYLDSPASSSAITYKIMMKTDQYSCYIKGQGTRGLRMIAMEISG
jgi:hypothetical protein